MNKDILYFDNSERFIAIYAFLTKYGYNVPIVRSLQENSDKEMCDEQMVGYALAAAEEVLTNNTEAIVLIHNEMRRGDTCFCADDSTKETDFLCIKIANAIHEKYPNRIFILLPTTNGVDCARYNFYSRTDANKDYRLIDSPRIDYKEDSPVCEQSQMSGCFYHGICDKKFNNCYLHACFLEHLDGCELKYFTQQEEKIVKECVDLGLKFFFDSLSVTYNYQTTGKWDPTPTTFSQLSDWQNIEKPDALEKAEKTKIDWMQRGFLRSAVGNAITEAALSLAKAYEFNKVMRAYITLAKNCALTKAFTSFDNRIETLNKQRESIYLKEAERK